MKKAVFVCFIVSSCLLNLQIIAAQNSGTDISVSIAVVLDCSYSMKLLDGSGKNRIDLMKRSLRELFAKSVRGVEWALITFQDTGSITVNHPFTTDPGKMLSAVESLEAGRLSPIAESLSFAADYLGTNARGLKKRVLLISDGISTEQQHFRILLPERFEKELIPLYIMGFEKRNTLHSSFLAQLARYTGGEFFTFKEVRNLKRGMTASEGQTGLNVWDELEDTMTAMEPPIMMAGFLWPSVLGPLFILVAILWNRRIKQQEKEQTTRQHLSIMNLSIRAPNGSIRLVRATRSPFLIGNSKDCSVRFPMDTGKRRDVFAYTWDDQSAIFTTSRPFLLNGVSRKSKVLKKGDTLRYGDYRVVFGGLERAAIRIAAPQHQALVPLAAGIFLVIASLLVTIINSVNAPAAASPEQVNRLAKQESVLQETDVEGESTQHLTASSAVALLEPAQENDKRRKKGGIREEIVQRSSISSDFSELQPVEEEKDPVIREASVTERAAVSITGSSQKGDGESLQQVPLEQEEKKAPTEPTETAVSKSATGPSYLKSLFPEIHQKRPLVKTPVKVIEPGQNIPFFKADILFIHAHPDDESLDFAGFMSKAARRGKRIVTLLFTDGESGLDQFPNRGVDGTHPSHHLQGGELAEVRVNEAKSALSYLGSEMYVRLGLINHPYSTSSDYLSLRTVFDRWGNKRVLEERLRRILEGFDPEVVVSCDYHEEAHEHFEHKAVGRLTLDVIRRLKSMGRSSIKGYLVSVDPFQKSKLHSQLWKIDLMERDPETGLTYREIQGVALKEHGTQGDASLIGVELLPNFRWEQYFPVFWELDLTPEKYIKS
jgi:LmbE family N-acetylglucosaminyl deacetylase